MTPTTRRYGECVLRLVLSIIVGTVLIADAQEDVRSHIEQAFEKLRDGTTGTKACEFLERELLPHGQTTIHAMVEKIRAPSFQMVDGKYRANENLATAIEVLSAMGEEAFRALRPQLETTNSYVRANVLLAIGSIDGEDTFDVLIDSLDDMGRNAPSAVEGAMRIRVLAYSGLHSRLEKLGYSDVVSGSFYSASRHRQDKMIADLKAWWVAHRDEVLRKYRKSRAAQ
jgi:hypothetical protein